MFDIKTDKTAEQKVSSIFAPLLLFSLIMIALGLTSCFKRIEYMEKEYGYTTINRRDIQVFAGHNEVIVLTSCYFKPCATIYYIVRKNGKWELIQKMPIDHLLKDRLPITIDEMIRDGHSNYKNTSIALNDKWFIIGLKWSQESVQKRCQEQGG